MDDAEFDALYEKVLAGEKDRYDRSKIEKRLAKAEALLRKVGFDFFGPAALGEIPDDKPPQYAAKKIPKLQKEKRPAAYLSESALQSGMGLLGSLEVGVYVPRGLEKALGLKLAEIDERIVGALKKAGFKDAGPHPDAPGFVQVSLKGFDRSPKR